VDIIIAWSICWCLSLCCGRIYMRSTTCNVVVENSNTRVDASVAAIITVNDYILSSLVTAAKQAVSQP
ncbi:MAG: hypothetical protein ACJ704_10500, partial [Nitrososphaeraceae archaeon]